ncbi:hypothetical protein ACTA71_009293 [Dictyostelium dimigraforme]
MITVIPITQNNKDGVSIIGGITNLKTVSQQINERFHNGINVRSKESIAQKAYILGISSPYLPRRVVVVVEDFEDDEDYEDDEVYEKPVEKTTTSNSINREPSQEIVSPLESYHYDIKIKEIQSPRHHQIVLIIVINQRD